MTVERIRVDGNENCDNFPVGMRVLAVDVNPICLKLLETLLRKCQYHVTTTSQARMALKMLCENRDRFDLVISDVHVPDMDGFKLLELVGLEMDLPVIMLSANSDPKLVLKGVTHGARDYLVKPVRIEELRNIWQHVVRRKKDSKEQNSSPDQVKGNRSGGEGNGSPMAGNAGKNGKFNRKRKEEEDESEDNGNEGKDPSSQKKPRVVWSIELHRKFVATVNQLGIDKAVPKRILDLMNVEGLTRENVASHLQKYRLYLRRISSVATQQANMVATLGVKNSPFIRMGPYEGFADFRSLVGQGRHGNPSLSPYSVGRMLGRLNSSATALNIHNITPPHLVPAGSHSQNATALGKMHPDLPSANQNPSLFQGIPSSLELDQLQQNKGPSSIMNFNPLDDSRMYTSSNAFNDPGATLGSTSNMLNAIPGNPVMLQGTANLEQTLSGGGFGNQSSHSVASFNLDLFNASVNGSSTLLDPGSVETSKMPQSPILTTEPFHSQMAVSSLRQNGFSSGPCISNNSIDVSSTLPLEVPREMQFQESLVGNAQNIVQTPSQRWGEQGQNYSPGSKSNFTFLSTRVTDSPVPLLNQNLDVYKNYNGFPLGLRVLAVDDDRICLKVLGILLRKCQYHVTTMNQASMALKTLWKNKDRFDLVIQNVHMLDMDGFRFLELVRFEMDLPVILLSASNDPKLVLKGLTHGACDYLIKPVRIEELRNIWQHVIRGTRLDLSEGEDTSTQRKPQVVWSVEVHRKFVAAVIQLGIEKAVPKKIVDLMNVEGLTRENVASHLQKYRLYLRRIHRASNAFNDPGTFETPKMQHSPILSTETFHSQLDVPLLNQNTDPEKGLLNQRIEMFAVKRISRKGSILAFFREKNKGEGNQGDEVWESGCWMKARNHLQTLKNTNVPSKLMMFLIFSCFCLFISFLVFYGFCPMVG